MSGSSKCICSLGSSKQFLCRREAISVVSCIAASVADVTSRKIVVTLRGSLPRALCGRGAVACDGLAFAILRCAAISEQRAECFNIFMLHFRCPMNALQCAEGQCYHYARSGPLMMHHCEFGLVGFDSCIFHTEYAELGEPLLMDSHT